MGVISTNVHITSRGTTLQGGSLPFCAGIGGCSATWITWCRLTDWGDVVDEMIRHVMHMYMIMCNYIYIYIYLFIFWGYFLVVFSSQGGFQTRRPSAVPRQRLWVSPPPQPPRAPRAPRKRGQAWRPCRGPEPNGGGLKENHRKTIGKP